MEEKEMYQYKELAESYLKFDFAGHLQQIKDATKDGWIDPLKAFLFFKQLEELAKSSKEEILENAVKEASMYEKGADIDGFKLEKINSAGRWDFKNIPVWNEKKGELKEIEDKYKAVYNNWKKGLATVDEDTGEQLTPPVYVDGKDTIKVSKLK